MNAIKLLFVITVTNNIFGIIAREDNMEIQEINTTMQHQTMREINVGATYKHYSGKLYKVLAIAHNSENPSLMHVVYQALYDCPTFGANSIWARPYAMFAENVVIDGK